MRAWDLTLGMHLVQAVFAVACNLRDARVLALWLDERGKRRSLSFIFADALEYYIDNKYPEAREGVRIVKNKKNESLYCQNLA